MTDASETRIDRLREGAARGSGVWWAVGVVGILSVAAIDYHTGYELRVFPLYYAPLAALAWYGGWLGAIVATGLASVGWLASNAAVGLDYSRAHIWILNTVLQTTAFATVAVLIAHIRGALARERELTRTDPLTELPNRVGFFDEAARLLAFCRRTERPVTVGFIDLDGFKAVNDRFGHDAGDDVLRAVAEVLRASVRPSDVAARLGGDEFVVLFPDTGAPQAAVALERLRASLAGVLGSSPSPVTSSIGGVTFEEVPTHAEELVTLADTWMYKAKERGRNRIALGIVGRSG